MVMHVLQLHNFLGHSWSVLYYIHVLETIVLKVDPLFRDKNPEEEMGKMGFAVTSVCRVKMGLFCSKVKR